MHTDAPGVGRGQAGPVFKFEGGGSGRGLTQRVYTVPAIGRGLGTSVSSGDYTETHISCPLFHTGRAAPIRVGAYGSLRLPPYVLALLSTGLAV